MLANQLQSWKDLRYLQKGNRRQQRAYAVQAELAPWPTLHTFGPVLAGTIPLAIDLLGSDLDVICEVPLPSQALFARVL